jgi:glycosyltransferase involved in cell wall biosynthesis
MNILFYLSRFPGYGGIETVTEIIGNRLVSDNHQITILSHVRQERDSALMPRSTYYLMPDVGKWDTIENEIFAINLVKNNSFDIIIVQDSYAPFERIVELMKASLPPKGRLVVFEHSTPLYKQKILQNSYKASIPQEIYRRLYSWPKQLSSSRKRHKKMLYMADAYVVLSDSYVDELKTVCGKKWSERYSNKIYVINNPIKDDTDSPSVDNKENIILFVGQINENKRIGFMLDAWEIISKDYPEWFFYIIGEGPQLNELKQRANSKNISNVFFGGFQKPDDYYKKAKLFWMSSGYEGWPLTIIESMKYGCVPIVTGSFSSIYDIIEDGRDGSIVKDNDLDAFVAATISKMQNEGIRLQLSEGALDKIKKFDDRVIYGKWKQLLSSLVK